MIVHEIPYLDTRDLNLDWLLRKIYTIEQRFDDLNIGKNIIIVDNFGAKGDGITDDTYAINKCIQDHPNAIIAFSEKTYRITDTLYLYGNQGGCLYFFGGAYIVYDGITDPNKPIVKVDHADGYESRCYILGGTFDGQSKAGIGIWLNKFHSTCDGTKVLDCTTYAYEIGTIDTGRSLQCNITDCFALVKTSAATDGMGWSDVNDAIGLAILEPDNVINGLNVNRYRHGIYIRSSGNMFTNCHLTTQYYTQRADMADNRAIFYDPASAGSINNDSFDNMYFDNCKYVFYCKADNKRSITISNSRYFNSGNQTTGMVEAFMVGGARFTSIDVDGFCVIPVGGKCRFYDASFATDTSYINMDNYVQRYQKSTFAMGSAYNITPLAQHFSPSGDTAAFLRGNDVDANKYIEAACLVIHSDHVDSMGCVHVEMNNRSHGTVSFDIYGVDDSTIEIRNTQVLRTWGIHFFAYVTHPEAATINGDTCYLVYIYLLSDQALTATYCTIKAEYGTPCTFYVNNDTIIVKDSLDLSQCVEVYLRDYKNFICIIGDSYANNHSDGLGGTVKGWGVILAEQLGNVINHSIGGYGFIGVSGGGPWSDILNSYPMFGTYLFVGGYNDSGNSYQDVYDAAKATLEPFVTAHPDVNIFLGCVAHGGTDTRENYIKTRVLPAYKDVCRDVARCVYLEFSEIAMSQADLISDGIHPDQDGSNKIAWSVKQNLFGNNLNFPYPALDASGNLPIDGKLIVNAGTSSERAYDGAATSITPTYNADITSTLGNIYTLAGIVVFNLKLTFSAGIASGDTILTLPEPVKHRTFVMLFEQSTENIVGAQLDNNGTDLKAEQAIAAGVYRCIGSTIN